MKALSLALVALTAGCAVVTQTDPLDREVGVRDGEQVVVDGGRLTVGVSGVPSDSRCPTDVVCVTAGEAVVVLTLAEPARAPAEVTLRTTPGKDAATYGVYRVQLLDLDPKPRSGGSPPETYLATLRIARE
ncbi:MAG TPA: hypothetical protein VGR37_09915 [Longimicrobiaceae bacterium]|nr:hypothetical protein [Longimicrobiaceae bacterium]